MSVDFSNDDNDDVNYEFNIIEKQGISSFYYFYLFVTYGVYINIGLDHY